MLFVQILYPWLLDTNNIGRTDGRFNGRLWYDFLISQKLFSGKKCATFSVHVHCTCFPLKFLQIFFNPYFFSSLIQIYYYFNNINHQEHMVNGQDQRRWLIYWLGFFLSIGFKVNARSAHTPTALVFRPLRQAWVLSTYSNHFI